MRRGDANHIMAEAAAPYIESGTKLLVHATLAGKGDAALAALRAVMSAVAEGEGERPAMSEDPNVGKGSPTTVRRRQKRSLDYQAGRRDYLRAKVDSAYGDMSDRMANAWRDDPGQVESSTLDSTVTDSDTDAYEAMVERLSTAWREG